MFYFPILGTINLFVATLRNPIQSSALSDIALVEIIAGLFARLEYISDGQIVITFAREIAVMARSFICSLGKQFSAVSLPTGTAKPGESLVNEANEVSFYEVGTNV